MPTLLTGWPLAEPLGVVPVLIGPLQVLLAILPAILGALGAAILAMLKPSAIRIAARMIWRNKVLALGVTAAIVGSCYLVSYARAWMAPQATGGLPGEGEWSAFRGGPERRGWAPGAPDPTSGGIVWAFDSEAKPFYSSPAVAGRRVFVASADKGVFSDRGSIYCLDAESGAIVWKYGPSDFRATFSSPAVGGGYVVSGEGLHFVRDGRITCLEADTGKLVWELRAASHVESSACIYNGKAYIGAGDDGLYCVALAPGPDGKPRVVWHLDGKQYPDCEASPLAHDGRVYFALGDLGHAVCCVDAETGREIWRTPTPYPVFGSPTLTDGRLFVGMGVGNFVDDAPAVLAKRLEALKREGATAAQIAEAKRTLAPAGEVWGLDPATGRVLSKTPVKETVLSPAAAADGRLYFSSRDGVVHCMDTAGKMLMEWNARDAIVSGPAVGQDHVYVVTDKGRLYALDRQTLKPAWEASVDTEGPCYSSPAVARGHVYVGSTTGGVLCLGQAGNAVRPTWGGYLGGPGRSGWADTSAPPVDAAVLWQYPKPAAGTDAATPAGAVMPPAYLDGSIYVGLTGKERTGLARLTLGRNPKEAPAEAWFYATANPPHTSPAVGGGRVYVVDGRPGDAGRSLHAVDVATGRAAWKAPVADAAPGDVVLAGDALLVRDAADTVTCYAPGGEQPAKAWSVQAPGIVGAPARAGGLVYLASTGEGVVAVDAATGARKWQRPLPWRVSTGPVATDDFLAVGTEDGLLVLSIVDGSPLWAGRCGPVRGTIAVDDDRVACVTAAGEIVFFDWLGKETLRARNARPGFAPMLCNMQAVWAAAESVERADLASGRTTRVLAAPWLKDAAAPPILVNSHLYFAAPAMGLVCVGPKE